MAGLHLRTVTRTQGNNRALKDGTVTTDGVELDFEEVPVLIQAFRRMVRATEFDVCEMAVTTYLCARAFGKPFTALPVFLVRGFHHGAIQRAVSSDVQQPADLEGARVGVNRGYTVTTGVWARGILADDYGVDLDKVTWVLSGDEHVAEYQPPDNVVPMPEGGDLAAMVADGELAAAIGVDGGDLVPLLPDPGEAAFDALRSRGLYPINHLIVVKDDVLEAHPQVAPALFRAFAEAKQKYVEELATGIENPTPTDRMYRRVLDITGSDPLPYGIEPNRLMIDELIRHATRQRILETAPDVAQLFAPGTHDLTA
jgi:4,5-dihydroxyphthalate decarboxylase